MGKAILAVIVTLIVGYLGMVVGLELLGNWDEFGLLIAIAVMGAFIIYFNDKKKNNFKLNKIAARWPAKAVAQLSFSQ